MKRNEFIDLLKQNLKTKAELDFLLMGKLRDGRDIVAFLDVLDVGMNVDVDDPENQNRGGIVFKIKEELTS